MRRCAAGIALTLAASAAACQRAAPRTAGQAPASAASASADRDVPVLLSIRPDTVRARGGDFPMFDIIGAGFDTARTAPSNTVRIGTRELTAVPAADHGTRLHILLVDGMATGGEAPPEPWRSGTYDVTVRTPRGASNLRQVVLIIERDRP